MLHISLSAETIVKIGNFPITNSLITTWIVMIFLTVSSFLITKKLKNKPSKIQSVAELLVGGLHDFFSGLVGKHASRLFPLVASYFLLILFSNWFGLLPGVGTIGIYKSETAVHEEIKAQTEQNIEPVAAVSPKDDHVISDKASADQISHETDKAAKEDSHESAAQPGDQGVVSKTDNEAPPKTESEPHSGPKFVPLFRAPTADLNMTLALALIAFFIIQYFGFSIVGPGYAKKFINFSNPIFFFVGILEIISDISKIISFAFRLFGNIFAGEVLLAVFAFLLPFIVPIPFLGMEIFVGFIQALVFSMLVAVFVNIAAAHAEHGEAAHGAERG